MVRECIKEKDEAWIIRWTSIAKDHEIPSPKIVSIMSKKTSSLEIATFMKYYWSALKHTISEKLEYGTGYEQDFDLNVQLVNNEDEIMCGYNPYLKAQKYTNIKIYDDYNGHMDIEYKDIHGNVFKEQLD